MAGVEVECRGKRLGGGGGGPPVQWAAWQITRHLPLIHGAPSCMGVFLSFVC